MEYYKNLSLEDLPNEVWKDVEGYEGLYKVSNLGRVKSLAKKRGGIHNEYYSMDEIMKQRANNGGYQTIGFTVNGKVKRFLVHRLVAFSFLKRIDGKDFVDHINGVRDDNRVENLRWCTHYENDTFPLAIENKRISGKIAAKKAERNFRLSNSLRKYFSNPKNRNKSSKMTSDLWKTEEYRNKIVSSKNSEKSINKSRHTSLCRAVEQYSLDGKFIREYYSASEAYRQTGISKITNCCRGERNKAGGFIWKYKNDK